MYYFNVPTFIKNNKIEMLSCNFVDCSVDQAA